MPQKLGKSRALLQAIFPLFLLLFFFHTTPFSRAIFHALVHERGIHHHHEGEPEDHSQQDHNSCQVHDPLLASVSLTTESPGRSLSQLVSVAIFPNIGVAPKNISEPEPPGWVARDFQSKVTLIKSAAHFLGSPLRAPPSA